MLQTTKGQKFKSASNNSLLELRSLLDRMQNLIDKDYCHVSEYLNTDFLSLLQNSINEVEKEVCKREDKGEL